MAITACVDTVTQTWLDGAEKIDGVRYRVIPVPRNPDSKRERYSGNEADPIRPATAQEIADAAAQEADAHADAQFDTQKAIKAALIVALWATLGHQPTAGELATAKTRFRAVYKAL